MLLVIEQIDDLNQLIHLIKVTHLIITHPLQANQYLDSINLISLNRPLTLLLNSQLTPSYHLSCLQFLTHINFSFDECYRCQTNLDYIIIFSLPNHHLNLLRLYFKHPKPMMQVVETTTIATYFEKKSYDE